MCVCECVCVCVCVHAHECMCVSRLVRVSQCFTTPANGGWGAAQTSLECCRMSHSKHRDTHTHIHTHTRTEGVGQPLKRTWWMRQLAWEGFLRGACLAPPPRRYGPVMWVSMRLFAYMCTWVHVCVCMHARACVCVCARACINVWMCVYTACVCVYVRAAAACASSNNTSVNSIAPVLFTSWCSALLVNRHRQHC